MSDYLEKKARLQLPVFWCFINWLTGVNFPQGSLDPVIDKHGVRYDMMSESVFTPEPSANKINWVLAAVAILVFPAVLIARQSVVAAVVVSGVALVAFAYLVWRVKNAHIFLDDNQISIMGSYSTRRIKRSDIKTTALVPNLSGVRSGQTAALLLLDDAGRSLVQLYAPYWSIDTLREVAAELGGPSWTAESATTVNDLKERFPKAFG
ncbi:MAG: hypothetical protein AB2715_20805 [Candidatus Thiodiazotropha sp.]